MILPKYLQDKILEISSSLKKSNLIESRQALTQRYKKQTGQSKSLIENRLDSEVYAISRMPATYAVIYTLVNGLMEQGFIKDVESVLDFGSGTGSGYFALKQLLDDPDFTLIERDSNMISMFNRLCDNEILVRKDNISNIETKADLVLTSYVLSEMLENERLLIVDKLISLSSKYLLIIDTGTPEVYKQLMKVKEYVENKGCFVTAPCRCNKCGLVDDYCQFYARVERTALHRQVKGGTLSYEDEKYFYLLIEKTERKVSGARVIRRPIIKEKMIELKVCDESGVLSKIYTKKDKDLFKSVKKAKINELV